MKGVSAMVHDRRSIKQPLTFMTSMPTSTNMTGTTYWNIHDLVSRMKYSLLLCSSAYRCLKKFVK